MVRPNIWKLQAEKDIDGLAGALRYHDPEIRRRAAAALRVLGATSAIPALKQAYDREPDSDARDAIMVTLEYLDDDFAHSAMRQRSKEELLHILTHGTPEETIRAAQSLAEAGDQLSTEALVLVFRNPFNRDDVRLAAAEALLKLKSAPAVVTLLAGLRKENWRIRHNAAAVLGQLRATWATQPLIERLEDENATVRSAAAAALRRFQTSQANQALETYKSRHSGKTGPLTPPPIAAPAPAVAATQPAPPPPLEPPAPVAVGDADPLADTRPKRPPELTETIRRLQKGIREATGKTGPLSPPSTAPTSATE